MKLLELKNVTAGYNGLNILNKINLTVNSNDFIGVIGPNGGGKTTLLKVILGLIKPKSGTISFTGMSNGIKSIGYLPQNNTFDHQFPISVMEVVMSGLASKYKLWKRPTKTDKIQAEELIAKTGMLYYKHTPIGELSGGQRQRVLLCRALIHNPQLLILDEPTTYVDKDFEGELYSLLSDLNKQMAILLVSHDIGIIVSYVKTIACINGTLHYHPSNKITNDLLLTYNCPVELVTHGKVPHRVLKQH
ncbi:MAG: ABC transporter ATP-binding protein [Marinilabiliaceae bacterium]|nr:ABC transporter ATP-binding protein [Marinilabiliaceae bacterium]